MDDDFEQEDEELGGFADETRMVRMSDMQPEGAGPMGSISVDPLPTGLEPRLEISAGPGRGKFEHIRKPLVILGRVDDVADIVVPNNSASRHHAAIGYKNGAFVLYDMGSTNGTLLNGERISEHKLEHGDEIEIGDNVFSFWTE